MFGRKKNRSSFGRGSSSSYGYPEYVPVSETIARNEKGVTALRKKNPNIAPVIVTGRKLAHSWWGIAWNTNLESYADYAYRLDRGRAYLRHGAVLDLQILNGSVEALVQGSSRAPYQINITVDPLKKADWDRIRLACQGQMSSMQALMAGKFPAELAEVLKAKGKGLFPSPKELHIRCSCPDYATLCKHAAAVLYGIGVRLDEKPELFFTLRGQSMTGLIEKAVADGARVLIEKAEVRSSRALVPKPSEYKDSDELDELSALFGIEFGTVGATKPDKSTNEKKSAKTRAMSGLSSNSIQKRRGRPLKSAVAAVSGKPTVVPVPVPVEPVAVPAKRRGRPLKSAVAAVSGKPAVVPVPLEPVIVPAKRRGRPPKAVVVQVPVPVEPVAVPAKRRGRPLKSAVAAVSGKPTVVPVPLEPVIVPAKRRGRPPKVDSAALAKPEVYPKSKKKKQGRR